MARHEPGTGTLETQNKDKTLDKKHSILNQDTGQSWWITQTRHKTLNVTI